MLLIWNWVVVSALWELIPRTTCHSTGFSETPSSAHGATSTTSAVSVSASQRPIMMKFKSVNCISNKKYSFDFVWTELTGD